MKLIEKVEKSVFISKQKKEEEVEYILVEGMVEYEIDGEGRKSVLISKQKTGKQEMK